MSTASFAAPILLTAEQFAQRPDPGYPEELVRGKIVPMPMSKPRHGEMCCQASYLLYAHIKAHDLGRLFSNDTGVITERSPDTVRGADLSYYSYTRVPKGPLPNRYLDTPPDLVVEVLSPSDRWPSVLAKVAEYLDAGTTVVIVLDDDRRLAHIYRADTAPSILGAEDELTIPDLFGDAFRTKVARFFD
jgi:Uma2 family endonuclease